MSNIFEEMADALTEATQTVGTKVKEVKDVSALKAKLHSHEKTVNETYLKIGRSYYNNHRLDEDSEYATDFANITKNLEEIKYLKECIENLKNQ